MTCCTCLRAVAALLPSLLLLLLPLPTPFSHLFARSSAQLLDPPRCGCSIIFANPFGYVAINKFSSVLVLLLPLLLLLLLLLLLFSTSDGKAIFPAFTSSRIASPLTTLLSLPLSLSPSVSACLCLCYQKWGATNLGLSWHVLLPLLRFFRIHFDCLSYFYEIISIASTGLRFAPYLYLLWFIVYSIPVSEKRETICYDTISTGGFALTATKVIERFFSGFELPN